MAVWIKVALLLVYLSVLFILTRLLEATIWYEQGQMSLQFLDPMTLSVLRLKAILEQRGVSFENMLEKQELSNLVQATGPVRGEELQVTQSSEDTPITNYTSDLDFYEQVEDAKDSMWLVEVVVEERPLLSDSGWHSIRLSLTKFGVRFGRFDCQHHTRMCTRKGWFSSRLVLAVPENFLSKANVVLYTYPGPMKVNAIFEWIKQNSNQQVKQVEDAYDLQDNWLTFPAALSPQVRVLCLSTLTSVPLFLSSLSVKFPGRVKIGRVNAATKKGQEIVKKLDIKKVPSYLVLTKQKIYYYGYQRGEVMTFKAWEIFLKCAYPNMNDIFIWSIILTNIAGCFEVCLANGGIFKRVIKLLFCLFQYNIILLLVWILTLGLLQLPFVEHLTFTSLQVIRIFTLDPIFSVIRNDLLVYSSNYTIPVCTLLVLIAIVSYFKPSSAQESEEESDWWNFSNLRTLNYHNGWEMMRLRPFDQIFNPSFGTPAATDIEHQSPVTVNSLEYISLLPVWLHVQHTCKCTISYLFSSEYTGMNSSPTMDLTPSIVHCCECGAESATLDSSLSGSSEITNDVLEMSTLGSTAHLPWNGLPHCARSSTIKNKNIHRGRPISYLVDSHCVICLEAYQAGSQLRGLPCRHVFHDKCILTWLLRDNHFCPTCRFPAFQISDYNDQHSE
ncbi:E3 ubiquitin-protein ligase RNF103-like [Dreissena polymorpha]|uniref:RING-type domain-containing protein n=1 Tax=Dreissena polymorpha TaxID=45954 RepID=A0A9D4BTN1_DREPO|nr:E3 ubiquitin-protein ligase RNF103-like [Dreissena polymorpha]XP_052248997.1 E3 ubiquitin-protein ligase RNF103-like [Dreissena polymorpha]XP_052248998.1 E3 ubiquitin-protein ligase RNF103-like [Dreissena polymorpha]XP_052248999.1 E3 ubiquitin-protein ligase RNF103-like [Dreissena polymorpha]KAH3708122.1 hypothetical protein DPMN_067561 [Dreissena polymorpha]